MRMPKYSVKNGLLHSPGTGPIRILPLFLLKLYTIVKRVFEIDVLECPECGDRMRILCAMDPPDAIRKMLDCIGLPSKPPARFRLKVLPGRSISPAVREIYFHDSRG